MKVWLLEVNHTPSFSTDSPLDWYVKKSLILDTMILINVKNQNKKCFYFILSYNELKNNPYKGSLKVSQQKFNQQNYITNHESKTLNGYLKIYPNEVFCFARRTRSIINSIWTVQLKCEMTGRVQEKLKPTKM